MTVDRQLGPARRALACPTTARHNGATACPMIAIQGSAHGCEEPAARAAAFAGGVVVDALRDAGDVEAAPGEPFERLRVDVRPGVVVLGLTVGVHGAGSSGA